MNKKNAEADSGIQKSDCRYKYIVNYRENLVPRAKMWSMISERLVDVILGPSTNFEHFHYTFNIKDVESFQILNFIFVM